MAIVMVLMVDGMVGGGTVGAVMSGARSFKAYYSYWTLLFLTLDFQAQGKILERC